MLQGGAVMNKDVLVGIVTDDTGVYQPDLPGRYTDIMFITEWIKEITTS